MEERRVKGFRRNIGANQMLPGETLSEFKKDCVLKLSLIEGNVLGNFKLSVLSYNNDTGLASIVFDRSISMPAAETLLDKDDLFLFE
jgi:hypothetical protein